MITRQARSALAHLLVFATSGGVFALLAVGHVVGVLACIGLAPALVAGCVWLERHDARRTP